MSNKYELLLSPFKIGNVTLKNRILNSKCVSSDNMEPPLSGPFYEHLAKNGAAWVCVGVGAYNTSAGAVFNIPIVQVPNLANALDELKEAGFWAAGATEHATQTCWDAPFEGRIALVMGSEGSGITRLIQEKCDFLCKLPQRGVTESLNVAQATTVLAYEWLRRSMDTPAGDPDESVLNVGFGDDFDLGGDRVNADLPPAGSLSATGSFRPLYVQNWDADDLDIGGDPL